MPMGLPFSAIERPDCETLQIHPFQTAHIDVDFMWVRAGNVIGVDTTDWAKIVFRGLRMKLIQLDCIFRGQQAKPGRFDNEMQEAFFGADRAVAIDHLFEFSRHLEPHSATVTSALVGWHKPLVE
jgi:hypothetical protein